MVKFDLLYSIILFCLVIGKNSHSKRVYDQDESSGNDEDNTDEVLDSETEYSEEMVSTEKSNAGWADSISKILKSNKPKKKKTLVLSKAKKLTDVPKTQSKPVGFQVETVDGVVKEEKIEFKTDIDFKLIKKKVICFPVFSNVLECIFQKRELPKIRVKPNILEKNREKTLQKIATKGVVQLFNAVKMQQKDVNKKLEEAGPLEVRKERVLKSIDKSAFLDVLMGEKSQKVDKLIEGSKNKSIANVPDSTWSVLKEDFLMGAKMKDWDKELEMEDATEQEFESESE